MSDSLFSRPFIKICGVTTLSDVRLVIDAGATAIGVNFSSSPRCVTLEVGADLASAARGQITRVAVFRDRSDEEILSVLDLVDVDAVQLHDRLSAGLEDRLRARDVVLLKALDVTSEDFLNFDDQRVDAVLLDGPRAGSGETYDWSLLGTRRFRVPTIGAGGLDADNVYHFIQAVQPWGVDCASGVELSPGRKDVLRVANFVHNARRAFDETGE